MRVRAAVTVTAGVAACAWAGAGVPASAAGAGAAAAGPVLRVGGEVSAPASYTTAQLAALPQVSYPVTEGKRKVRDSGVLLETLVSNAGPAYPTNLPSSKNPMLRVTVSVRGASGYQVTFALGELTPGYGNHPVVLALTQNGKPITGGPELVVPEDRTPLRFVHRVRQLTIGIASAPATDTKPPAGSPVQVIEGGRMVTLTAARLARLPRETLTVSFSGPKGMETKRETGPSLLAVLAAAGVRPNPGMWVEAVGEDNYAVIVTPSEQFVGRRELQLSLVQDGARLSQPRLVPDGDFFGDRFVYGIVDLYVGAGPAS